jgi:hypothetical protein
MCFHPSRPLKNPLEAEAHVNFSLGFMLELHLPRAFGNGLLAHCSSDDPPLALARFRLQALGCLVGCWLWARLASVVLNCMGALACSLQARVFHAPPPSGNPFAPSDRPVATEDDFPARHRLQIPSERLRGQPAGPDNPDGVLQYSVNREQPPGDHGSGLLPGQCVQTQQQPPAECCCACRWTAARRRH